MLLSRLIGEKEKKCSAYKWTREHECLINETTDKCPSIPTHI